MFIFLNSVAVEQEEVVTKRQYYVDGREYYQVFLANHAVLKSFMTGNSMSCLLHSLRMDYTTLLA